MIKIENNIDLLPFNTFRVAARAKYFCEIGHIEVLRELINTTLYAEEKHLILGEGSNVLFGGDFDGMVIKTAIHGIDRVRETKNHIWIRAHAGENWCRLVTHAVNNNWGGIENLSAIPGTVGAAPIQNIGAYGVEIKDVIDHVETVELASGALHTFSREECQLGYRDSIFKNTLKKKHLITSITLKLTRHNHKINTQYGAIHDWLRKNNEEATTLRSVSNAITQIRQHKLPNPATIGNAGSFFKNPVIPHRQYLLLKQSNPDIPCYTIDDTYVKVPAGWLIEQCGWKGKKLGAAGIHPKQALVLVNYGGSSGKAIIALAEKVRLSVLDKFNIALVPEVTIVQ